MKSIEITGTKRVADKSEAKRLRTQDQVPCILYGGSENVTFSASAMGFKKLVYTPDVHTVKLNIEGNTYDAVLQDIQFHPVTDAILHIDFLQIFPDKPVIIDVPVRAMGTSEGQRMGGKLIVKSKRLKVKALPADLPDYIELDITPLNIGQSIRVEDMKINNVEFLDAPNNIIIAIRTTRVVASPVEEAAAAPAAAPAEASSAEENK